MTDTKQLLDGNVEDVKTRLSNLDTATLAALLAAEEAGKNRKGVTDAIKESQTAASTKGASTDRGDGADAATTTNIGMPAAAVTTAASLDQSPQANIAPATEFDAAGAPVQSTAIDLNAASLDANPRANTTEDQNRIDFNDPVKPGHEVVADALKDQAQA